MAQVPPVVTDRFRSGETLIHDDYEEATVLFMYVSDYEQNTMEHGARETIRWMNDVLSRFDRCWHLGRWGGWRLWTGWDSQMSSFAQDDPSQL